jgi:hypothetical protein
LATQRGSKGEIIVAKSNCKCYLREGDCSRCRTPEQERRYWDSMHEGKPYDSKMHWEAYKAARRWHMVGCLACIIMMIALGFAYYAL